MLDHKIGLVKSGSETLEEKLGRRHHEDAFETKSDDYNELCHFYGDCSSIHACVVLHVLCFFHLQLQSHPI